MKKLTRRKSVEERLIEYATKSDVEILKQTIHADIAKLDAKVSDAMSKQTYAIIGAVLVIHTLFKFIH